MCISFLPPFHPPKFLNSRTATVPHLPSQFLNPRTATADIMMYRSKVIGAMIAIIFENVFTNTSTGNNEVIMFGLC